MDIVIIENPIYQIQINRNKLNLRKLEIKGRIRGFVRRFVDGIIGKYKICFRYTILLLHIF